MSQPKRKKSQPVNHKIAIDSSGHAVPRGTKAHHLDTIELDIAGNSRPQTVTFGVTVVCGGKDDYVVLLSSSRKRSKKSGR